MAASCNVQVGFNIVYLALSLGSPPSILFIRARSIVRKNLEGESLGGFNHVWTVMIHSMPYIIHVCMHYLLSAHDQTPPPPFFFCTMERVLLNKMEGESLGTRLYSIPSTGGEHTQISIITHGAFHAFSLCYALLILQHISYTANDMLYAPLWNHKLCSIHPPLSAL